MAEHVDLLARIAEKAGVDETAAEEVLAKLVGELVDTAKAEPERSAIELPPYFDRYVTTEIIHLKEYLSAFRAEVDRRFTEMDNEMDRRFTEMDNEMDRRFTEMGNEMNRRFAEMGNETNRRFAEMGNEMDRRFGEMDRRFDRLERWFFVVGVPIVLGILTIIVKIFFSVI